MPYRENADSIIHSRLRRPRFWSSRVDSRHF